MNINFYVLCFSFLLANIIVYVAYASGLSKRAYTLFSKSVDLQQFGKVVFGIEQSIVASIIFVIIVPSAPFSADLTLRYFLLFLVGLTMIFAGLEFERKRSTANREKANSSNKSTQRTRS